MGSAVALFAPGDEPAMVDFVTGLTPSFTKAGVSPPQCGARADCERLFRRIQYNRIMMR